MQNLTLTKDTGRLSIGQRIFYERNGFIVIPRLVPMDILDRCMERFDGYVTGRVEKGFTTVMRDVVDRKSVYKIQDITHDDVFNEYFENKDVLDYVENFIGPNIVAIHSMLICKPPDVGSGSTIHPPHQDLLYFPIRPANKIVASWTAIEKCVKANGCLYVMPGSHLAYDLQPHGYPENIVNKAFYGIQNLPESANWVDVEMEPGDTVFFHPLLIHGSWKNVTNRPRPSISCHYAAGDCHYINVDGSVQQGVKDELLAIAKRRLPPGNDVSYSELWKIKSNLVRGIRSSL